MHWYQSLRLSTIRNRNLTTNSARVKGTSSIQEDSTAFQFDTVIWVNRFSKVRIHMEKANVSWGGVMHAISNLFEDLSMYNNLAHLRIFRKENWSICTARRLYYRSSFNRTRAGKDSAILSLKLVTLHCILRNRKKPFPLVRCNFKTPVVVLT